MKLQFEDLKNKTCVITGGSGVIGLAIVNAVAGTGANVAIISRNKKVTDEKIALEVKNNKNVEAFEADILNEESLASAKKKINEKFGEISILINCAGGNDPKATTQFEVFEKENKFEKEKSFLGLDKNAVQNVFTLNFQGTLIPTQIFSEDMIKNNGGVILNISSISSFRPLTKVSAYSSAKAAINNLTQWLAIHLADMNIRVNAIAPGFILAEQNKFLLMDENEKLTKRGEKIISATPMKRFLEADEISGAVLFLVSDLSKAVTGVILPVDGGFNSYSGV